MPTYCESIGLKVGDKIRFLGPDDHDEFSVEDILTLEEDDGTPTPCFRNQDNVCKMFCLPTRRWERVYDVPTLPEEWFIACGNLLVVRELMDRAGLTWINSDSSRPTEFLLNVQILAVTNSRISWIGSIDYILDNGIPEITYSQLKEYVNYHFPEREVITIATENGPKKVYKDDYLKTLSDLKEVV